ncbi:hypothetical protein EDD18DRAFT_460379 [Armillaria luteobubalina]|uniref:Uncharacterized protein n=1 Tax=Armillaria luteobubalina TaxID=153913 RepID=A0AA39PXV7_9AGAR|nr:hypothetical protein EDD18DRAFT_460379 [Armillaria luteobubalina]
MNQISVIVLVLLFSSNIFAEEISPKDSEDFPTCPTCLEDRRTLLSIIWSCLATIFACTWISIHPNVPGRNITTRGQLACAVERMKIMITTIFAPEIIVAWAAHQFIVARKVCRKRNLTMAHGFMVSMGGFCYNSELYGSRSPLSQIAYLDFNDLYYRNLLKKVREVSAETIEDKSKGDALSKTFSILQIFWFIAQCLARVAQNLPITLLEVTALASAGLSVITYCLWWNKPLNVKYHISLDGSDPTTFRLTPETESHFLESVMSGIASIFAGEYMDDLENDIGHGTFRFSPGDTDGEFTRSAILLGVGSLFGALHCVAWSFSFPSHTEMVLWRFSSLAMLTGGIFAAGYPLVMVVINERGAIERWHLSRSCIQYEPMRSISGVLFSLSIVAYIIARIILIVLTFIQLRSLPSLAFRTVQWTTYIPHI